MAGRAVGVLVQTLLGCAVWGAVCGAGDGVGAFGKIDGRVLAHAVWVPVRYVGVLRGVLFEVLVTVHFCGIDGRVLGGMQVTVRAQFCKIDRRVLWGMQLWVLVQLLFGILLGAV